jgi:hypothetical protein
VSCTLDPKKVSDLHEELQGLQEDLGKLAKVSSRTNLAIVSLICNVDRTSSILERVRCMLICMLLCVWSTPVKRCEAGCLNCSVFLC